MTKRKKKEPLSVQMVSMGEADEKRYRENAKQRERRQRQDPGAVMGGMKTQRSEEWAAAFLYPLSRCNYETGESYCRLRDYWERQRR